MVYIILLNYNNWEDTIESLESVLKLEYPSFKVIVVDNFSQNNSLEYIHLWAQGKVQPTEPNLELKHLVYPLIPKPLLFKNLSKPEALATTNSNEPIPPLITIQAGNNGGFAAGNNIGVKFAMQQKDCEFIWLLNNDTVVEKDALSELVKHYKGSTSQIGILGSKLLFYHNPSTIQAIAGKYNKWLGSARHIGENSVDEGQFNAPNKSDIGYIVGASMFVSRDFIEDVGLMREDYFLYFEELDWTYRGKAKGKTIDVCTASIVYHKEGASIKTRDVKNKSKLGDYYSLRNRILFTKRFFPIALPTVYLTFLGVILNRLKRRQFDRLWMIVKILFRT